MKLHNLSLKRNESYASENPGQLAGTVQFECETGKQEVRLSPMAILALLKCVEEECITTAKRNAKDVPQAFRNAEGELNLIEHPMNLIE